MALLRNCKVVDVRKGTIREDPLVIEGGIIASFGNSKTVVRDSIDLEGGYLIPGLMNCHAHLAQVFPFHERDVNERSSITALRCLRRGIDALRAGVTTVRTVGTRHAADIDLRTMIHQGWIEGPRILSAGRSLAITSEHGSSGVVLADGPDEFQKKAREQLLGGSDHLKIYITGGIAGRSGTFDEPQMTLKEMQAVVSVARSKNTYVTAHAGGSEAILKAVGAGVRCFEHGYFIDRKAALAMRKQGAYLCPTLCVSRAPHWMQQNRFETWTIEKALSIGSDHLESIRVAVREGVKVITGTDIPPGDVDEGINITVREMEYLVDSGLSPLGAIQASTVSPAELMGIEKQVGVLEPGYRADLVATRENPLADILALRRIFFVMQCGRVIRWDHA